MSIHARIENARSLLRSGRIANEASISSGVVLPILDALGWPAFNPSVVAPEYSVGKRRVDFALLTKGTPAVFLEVKQPGLADGADRQLFEYAFHEGVPIAILTDGTTWHFYLPAMQGSYDERRVYLLDLLEREPSESAERLERYLSRDAVESGDAFDRARQDYKRTKQRKEASEAIPQAWANLVADADGVLEDLLAAEVERVSGFEADPRDVRGFLKSLSLESTPLPKAKAARRPPRTHHTQADQSKGGYEINGNYVACRMGRDVIAGVFRSLASRDPQFPERFATQVKGKKRAYLARSRTELYPGRPDFANQSVEIAPGWFVATHNSSDLKKRIIQKACKVAGLQYGVDVKVWMP